MPRPARWRPWALCLLLLPAGATAQPANGSHALLPDFLRRWVAAGNVRNAPRQPYSSHRCVNSAGEGSRTDRLVCLLDNVCLNPAAPAAGTLVQYFENVDAVRATGHPSPKYFDNGTKYAFPPFPFCEGRRHVVSAVQGPLPSNALWMTPSVYALACPVRCQWFSHNWIDNVIPYFWAAQALEAYDPSDFGIVWNTALNELKQTALHCQCTTFFRKWVWPSGLVKPTSACRVPRVGQPVCFRHLIVGGQAFSYFTKPMRALSGLEPAYRAMRDFVRYGLAGLRPGDGPARQHVLLLLKRQKRRILNVRQLALHLRLCFPGLSVAAAFPELPPEQQVRLVNGATVIVAPSGTVAYSALFAAPHTVLIQLDRYNPATGSSSGADQYVFRNAGVPFLAYPVRRADVVLEFPKGYAFAKRASPDFQQFALGSVRVDTQRMVRLVYWAMQAAQDMRGGDDRFAFPRHSLHTPACRDFRDLPWRQLRPLYPNLTAP